MQYGHFDDKNREYVIDRIDLPWTMFPKVVHIIFKEKDY